MTTEKAKLVADKTWLPFIAGCGSKMCIIRVNVEVHTVLRVLAVVEITVNSLQTVCLCVLLYSRL